MKMNTHKAFKFRIYPSYEQSRLLLKTVGCCRLVYNLALEQRGFSRLGRSINYNTAANDLPALKKAYPFLKEPPAQCLQQALVDLDRAFQAFFKSGFGYPNFRKKYEHESCRFPQPSQFDVSRTFIDLPKFGKIRMMAHRKPQGRILSATVSKDGSHWYVSITCEVETKASKPRQIAEVGVDLNVATGAATSDGDFHAMPLTSCFERRKQTRLQQAFCRKKRGSHNRHKARLALQRFHAKIRRRRLNATHVASKRLADRYTHIAFEDLRLKNMTKSARGTVENPGRNVRQKAGLNRAILDVAPGLIKQLTMYKSVWRGGICTVVDPRYTSQTCSECKRHPKDETTEHLPHGRVSRDRFVCPLCGYMDHADINAAKNILALGQQHWLTQITAGGPPVAASGGLCGEHADERRQRSRAKAALKAA
jgi:putative transposase